VKKAKEMGVEMPKYFKPGAVNPLSYAEQVQKRKMMWSKPAGTTATAASEGDAGVQGVAKNVGGVVSVGSVASQAVKHEPPQGPKTSFNKWETTNFGDDKANEKFRRLMGIKSTPAPTELSVSGVATPHANQDRIKEDLEKNYEVARQQTHRNRGLGLGFSNIEPSMPEQYAVAPPPPNPYIPPTQPRVAPVWPSRPATGNINFIRKHH